MPDPDPSREPKLDEFLCFAVYSANLAFSRTYRPLLDALGLTYLQYIVLVALWERDAQLVGSLCDRVFLTTSTITPVIKKLERSGLVVRRRRPGDDRQVSVELNEAGRALRAKASGLPACILSASGLPAAQLEALVGTMVRLRDTMLQQRPDNAPAPEARPHPTPDRTRSEGPALARRRSRSAARVAGA